METTTVTFFDLIRPDLSRVEETMRISPGDHDPNLIAALDHLHLGQQPALAVSDHPIQE